MYTFELLFIDSFVVLMIFILLEGFLQIRSVLPRTPEKTQKNSQIRQIHIHPTQPSKERSNTHYGYTCLYAYLHKNIYLTLHIHISKYEAR